MSNLQIFTVLQFGSTDYNSQSQLLNMDFFADAFDNGSNTTFVKYTPFKEGNWIAVILNETLAAVNAKLTAKTPPANVSLFVLSVNNVFRNTAITLETALFARALAAVNPTQSIIQYLNPDGLTTDNYLVNATLQQILDATPSSLASFSFAMQATTTGVVETIDIMRDGAPYTFTGGAGSYLVTATPVGGGGAVVQAITNLSGSQFELTSSVPDTFNFTLTSI